MNIEYKEKLDKHIEKLIDNEFERYANKNNLQCNYRTFNFTAKEADEIAGILTGYTVYDEVYIDLLLIFEKYRNKGIGTQLIKQVEDYYSNKNFKYIHLVTCEFQAPNFYKKCGFKLEFKREHKENPKLTQYFFIKYF